MNAHRLAIAIAITVCVPAHAAVWVGYGTRSVSMEIPSGYTSAVGHLFHRGSDFETLPEGTDAAAQDLGGFYVGSTPTNSVRVTKGISAGAAPSSGQMSLYLSKATGTPTVLTIGLFEPVMSVGLALMGLESSSTLRIYGGNSHTDLLGVYTIPPAGTTNLRRWVGVYEDERTIWKMQLTPGAAEDYAIDDVEIGVHAPEPGSLVIFALGGATVLKRRKRGPQVV
jgi:hypothetical protein